MDPGGALFTQSYLLSLVCIYLGCYSRVLNVHCIPTPRSAEKSSLPVTVTLTVSPAGLGAVHIHTPVYLPFSMACRGVLCCCRV